MYNPANYYCIDKTLQYTSASVEKSPFRTWAVSCLPDMDISFTHSNSSLVIMHRPSVRGHRMYYV